MKTPERRHWPCSGVLIANFEHIFRLFFSVSIVNFEQVNVCCVMFLILFWCSFHLHLFIFSFHLHLFIFSFHLLFSSSLFIGIWDSLFILIIFTFFLSQTDGFIEKICHAFTSEISIFICDSVITSSKNIAISDLLTLSWRRPLSYRNQCIDLLWKSMDWFLHDNDHRHERVKMYLSLTKIFLKIKARFVFDFVGIYWARTPIVFDVYNLSVNFLAKHQLQGLFLVKLERMSKTSTVLVNRDSSWDGHFSVSCWMFSPPFS